MKPKPALLTVEYLAVDALIPYARNSRTHDETQVAQIAASIKEFGFTNPVLIDEEGGIIAGHGRIMAARKLGMAEAPTITLRGLTEAQKRAYIIADNRLPLNAGWDFEMLAVEIDDLKDADFDVSILGFTSEELNDLIGTPNPPPEPTGPEVIPEVQAKPVTKSGEVWLLGEHRVMCGDSTDAGAVAVLMNGGKASLIHADPPYGMGKQADGVANDNLYREKLDAFQMAWWRTFRQFSDDNASAYIWGNSPDLWRLWYAGGLADSENLYFCNHIVWDKKSIPGMASDLMLQFPIASEHCLFFKIGDQFVGNVNADQYWEDWDVIRLYLKEQADTAGLNPKRCQEITGVQMYAHWFSKSQWSFIPEKYYDALHMAFPELFGKQYEQLRKQYEQIKGGYRNHINGIQGGMRSYFNNAHDAMRDVWEFSRVIGDERHGHATPKPVDMMERVMLSSLPEGGLCAEPFGGSGSTLMGAEKTGRICYTMEMQECYVDVIVRRWQTFTGKHATLENDGRTFEEVSAERITE